jgi:hypothetical protein
MRLYKKSEASPLHQSALQDFPDCCTREKARVSWCIQCCKLKLRYLEYKMNGNVQQNINRCTEFYEFITPHTCLCACVSKATLFPYVYVIFPSLSSFITIIYNTLKLRYYPLLQYTYLICRTFRHVELLSSYTLRIVQAKPSQSFRQSSNLPTFCRTRAAFPIRKYTWPRNPFELEYTDRT